MSTMAEFRKKYREVFDDTGNIKACGRKKCIELIELAKKVQPGNYGDVKTGFINIDNINDLYNRSTI
ncbi:MAG: hypothetical protein IJZ79_03680 [Bacilli bacterium]|nr:hypothetical protein [Bacilli bacterium]MBQ8218830.1 hypothetical protein [Bacilli bacterium]